MSKTKVKRTFKKKELATIYSALVAFKYDKASYCSEPGKCSICDERRNAIGPLIERVAELTR